MKNVIELLLLAMIASQSFEGLHAQDQAPAPVALLRIALDEPRVLKDPSGDPLADRVAAWKIFCNTQRLMLKNAHVRATPLQRPDLAALASVRAEKDPVAWLQSRLKAEMVEDSEILAIRLQDVAPEDARILLRAIVESYLTQVVHRDRDLSQDRLFRLKEIQLTLQNAVKNKKSNLRQLAEALMRAFRDETEVQFMFCRC